MIVKLPLVKRTLIVRKPFKLIPTREVRTGGFDSRTQDGMYVIFLDYDEIKKEIMVDDERNLIERFRLSPFYNFETKPESFHGICLDKLC